MRAKTYLNWNARAALSAAARWAQGAHGQLEYRLGPVAYLRSTPRGPDRDRLLRRRGLRRAERRPRSDGGRTPCRGDAAWIGDLDGAVSDRRRLARRRFVQSIPA